MKKALTIILAVTVCDSIIIGYTISMFKRIALWCEAT